MTIFKAYQSTVKRFIPIKIGSIERWLSDPITGAIVGVQVPTANGADARFVPVDLTAAQISSPTADMIADLDATFRLNVSPYTRYQSNGSTLVSLGGGGFSTVNSQTGTTYTLIPTDSGKIVTLDNASSITLTVPVGLGANFNCTIMQLGAGQVTINPVAVTVNSYNFQLKLLGQYAVGGLYAIAADNLILAGNLTT